ncbi:hypothetical protein M885DRAFT_476182 [Pelagophyceae sp. CCMP2097]|nr:hypothetical protein M885DRAFT_476182 [Pelagophyceae sp. CCMP2097]
MADRPPSSQLQEYEDPGAAASAAVVLLAKRTFFVAKAHPRVCGTWMLGLALVVFATGFRISASSAAAYEAGMARADLSEPISKAAQRLARLRQQEYASSGWFACDAQCQHYRNAATHAQRELEHLRHDEVAAASDVKANVGVFSEYGVAEARDTFWATFAGGKDFAKRQSMWDLLFRGLSYSSSRDENAAAVVLRWLIQLLFNFTLGLCGALVVFWYKLWGLVSSYQPNPIAALCFAAAAGLAATSMVATYLFAMYFCAASGVAAVGAAAQAQARIEAQRRNDPARVHDRAAQGAGGVRYRRQNF